MSSYFFSKPGVGSGIVMSGPVLIITKKIIFKLFYILI